MCHTCAKEFLDSIFNKAVINKQSKSKKKICIWSLPDSEIIIHPLDDSPWSIWNIIISWIIYSYMLHQHMMKGTHSIYTLWLTHRFILRQKRWKSMPDSIIGHNTEISYCIQYELRWLTIVYWTDYLNNTFIRGVSKLSTSGWPSWEENLPNFSTIAFSYF